VAGFLGLCVFGTIGFVAWSCYQRKMNKIHDEGADQSREDSGDVERKIESKRDDGHGGSAMLTLNHGGWNPSLYSVVPPSGSGVNEAFKREIATKIGEEDVEVAYEYIRDDFDKSIEPAYETPVPVGGADEVQVSSGYYVLTPNFAALVDDPTDEFPEGIVLNGGIVYDTVVPDEFGFDYLTMTADTSSANETLGFDV